MSPDEQARLRRKREANELIAGRKTLKVENVQIRDVHGEVLKTVAEFKYLGTLVTTDGWSTKEINRGLGIAGSTMESLQKIWADHNIPIKLKCQLYKALVMTIVLYNGECWLLNKQDLTKLEGFHFRCLRRITRKQRCPGLGNMQVDRASRKEVLIVSQVPTQKS